MKIKIKRNARAMSPTPPPPPTAVGSGSEGILCRAHADEDLIVVWSGRAAADRASASCSLRRLRPFAFLHRIVATRSIWTLGTGTIDIIVIIISIYLQNPSTSDRPVAFKKKKKSYINFSIGVRREYSI